MINPTEAQLKAVEEMGFVICKLPPDEEECETCETQNLQLWYTRTCFENDEGEYHCIECIEKMPQKRKDEADKFVKWMDSKKEGE